VIGEILNGVSMNNKEIEAEELYQNFIDFCVKNDIIPQKIILKHFDDDNLEEFFEGFRIYK